MKATIAFSPKRTLEYVEGGGHLWVFLNWALALQALGCRVFWLEVVKPSVPTEELPDRVRALQHCLESHGLGAALVLYTDDDSALPIVPVPGRYTLREVAAAADLLLNFRYELPESIGARFRRRALIDIDPGLTQIWINEGQLEIAPHDFHFTIGETVGAPGGLIPDCGLSWHYTPPPVYLAAWPVRSADPQAPFTTVTHWGGPSITFGGQSYANGKREGFLPYLDLPRETTQPLELATYLRGYEPERKILREHGWQVVESHEVAGTSGDYQRYVQQSRGEFSCAKPSCRLLQNAWISDRTICYLASGKPAVDEYTGPSRFLPDAEGLFRFRDLAGAAAGLAAVAADYDRQSKAARALAEKHFDAMKVIPRVLDAVL